jgi:hypothetical protein
MTFRANEAAEAGRAEAVRYLSMGVPENRSRVEELVRGWVAQYGPVVEGYPTWHPLMAGVDALNPRLRPDPESYPGLDHTVCFANAFVTCPYVGGGARVMEGAYKLPQYGRKAADDWFCGDGRKMPPRGYGMVSAERLDEALYNTGTEPVLVVCDWGLGGWAPIPQSEAVPRMLEHELPCRHGASIPESWESMHAYLLGSPHGTVSSLFVERETGTAMRRIWRELMNSGAFGPPAKMR